jgi:hypothetical protein
MLTLRKISWVKNAPVHKVNCLCDGHVCALRGRNTPLNPGLILAQRAATALNQPEKASMPVALIFMIERPLRA